MTLTRRSISELVQEIIIETQEDTGVSLTLEDSLMVKFAGKDLLNEKGQNEIQALHQKIMNQTYRPWLHNIKHMCIDHKGNVYWKMQLIEHLKFPWVNKSVGKDYVKELDRRCHILEQQQKECDIRSVVLEWKEPNTRFIRES